jgi:hypothetical protein
LPTRPIVLLLFASTLAFLLVSSALVIGASAQTAWYSSDNGEFDCSNSTYPCYLSDGYMNVEAYISTKINTYNNGSQFSLQYNPDEDTSVSYQTHDSSGNAQWFQTWILGSGSSCVIFGMEVYDTSTGAQQPSWHSNNDSCTDEHGIFYSGAYWYISEYTGSGSTADYVVEVDYTVQATTGSPLGYYTYAVYPQNYGTGDFYWLRSNTCWCGTNNDPMGSVDFTSGAGTLYSYSGSNVYSINPPTVVATKEVSDMYYGCWSNSGTTDMSQSFSTSSSVQC